MTTESKNDVWLEGTVLDAPQLSHENHGTQFYRFSLCIPRLSGQADTLPILVPESLLSPVNAGASVRIHGQLRSFNNRSGVGSRLVLTVYALQVETGSGEFRNQITLSGTLCKPPIFRRTPLGRSICDLMLAVSRRYGRADYLPVIAWGQLAIQSCHLGVGDALSLEGRIQSRIYHKVMGQRTEERIAYEVSMMHLLDEAAKAAL
ncbi:Single-strand binding protein family protein [Oscillibacter sp. PC13]|uniref:single-stranded DNA-binding protein n=1 Tax=Oscillibacter sp. PC13 TaxID=1855299 RepID=UPI0008E5C436|nr:single-stranded DNA-binding protein [Oscillibacter sp. PC13]SFP69183.1 Single-strand binding protein family protein [Oscillibacter sp. PC13]